MDSDASTQGKSSSVLLARNLRSRYCPVPDRLLLKGECMDGLAIQLWVSRRILSQIVPYFVRYMDHVIKVEGEVFLRRVQSSLVQDLSKAAKVKATQAPSSANDKEDASPLPDPDGEVPNESKLVTQVQMKPTPKGWRMEFVTDSGIRVEWVLPPLALCRWMAILQIQSQNAQWQLDVWPNWLDEIWPANTQWADKHNLLH
jgi:hypothetical protein